ncbi:very short patch repair endonuclease [Mesobacillus subterraneus]|uniref:very short patch repair endonuclease n=1 Tax=Mesobacillus subterraneus TaxID=285983 RepID=UPI00203B178A|nr:very short patch repair endonuclease [Mesobacillus subterraneus]MCM3572281.1 very short patch repair endonuclease [Mesobacillus subterraneus]
MPEKLTKEQRSNNMKAIKSQSSLENKVSKALWKQGFRFRKNAKMFGRPDISIKKYKVVIFIDSCFWHCCPKHGNMPKTNQEYWTKKLQRNISRDVEVNHYYINKGWNLLRIWEHEFKSDFNEAVSYIASFIKDSINFYTNLEK